MASMQQTGITSQSKELLVCWPRSSFDFIITFLTVYRMLSHLEGITVKLQSKAIDILEANEMVINIQIVDIKSLYKEYRRNITDEYHIIYQHAIRMAEAVDIQLSQPRAAGKQKHRKNTKADTPEQYYLRNFAIPFTDHLIIELDKHF